MAGNRRSGRTPGPAPGKLFAPHAPAHAQESSPALEAVALAPRRQHRTVTARDAPTTAPGARPETESRRTLARVFHIVISDPSRHP
ncbi:hypothetical protein GCM10020295_29180 [Streptomyces cinereospinus]